MHFAEEHCFGCALALRDCVDNPTDHKTFTTRLKSGFQADYLKTIL